MISSRARFAVSMAAALVCLAAYVATMSGHLFSPDAEVQFRTTESLALRGTTAIEPIEGGFATLRGPDGEEYAQYGIGMPLAALPFYALGAWLDSNIPDSAVPGLFWPTTQYHGGSPSEWKRRLGASMFNSATTSATVGVFCWILLGWGLSKREGFACAMLFGLGTCAWAHARTFFSEPLAALLAFGAFGLVAAWRESGLKGWAKPLLAGLLAGFGFLVRKDQPLFFPGLCLFALSPAFEDAAGRPLSGFRRERFGRAFGGASLAGAGMLAMMAVHFAVAWAQWGDWKALGYEGQAEGVKFAAPLHSGIYGFLFSVGRGMFFASPALLLALWGWPELWRRRPAECLGAALACAPFFLLMCRWQNWAGGWSWGPRHIYQLHVFLAMGFAGFFLKGKAPLPAPEAPPSDRRRAWGWLALLGGCAIVGTAGGSLQGNVAGGLVLAGGLAALLPLGASPHPNSRAREEKSLARSRKAAKEEKKEKRKRPALPKEALAGPPKGAGRLVPPNRWIAAGLALALGAGVQAFACSQSFIDYYILYFRLPEVPPSSRALYAAGEAAGHFVEIEIPGMPPVPRAPLSSRALPAPIMDSVYAPHNSAWAGYRAMWAEGFHDLFWRRFFGWDALPPAATSLEVYRGR